jgi:hypothetical protein
LPIVYEGRSLQPVQFRTFLALRISMETSRNQQIKVPSDYGLSIAYLSITWQKDLNGLLGSDLSPCASKDIRCVTS